MTFQRLSSAKIKNWLRPGLNVTSRLVDRSLFLQKLVKTIAFPGKLSVVRRLTSFSSEPIQAECRGSVFELNCKDLLQREIYFNAYDRKKLPQLLHYVRPGGTYIDLGANIGFYTLHMARKMGPKGRLFAIEADPQICSHLQRNCQLNAFSKQVHVINRAFSDREGSMSFYTHDGFNSGSGSLNCMGASSGQALSVQATTLDAFMQEQGIVEVDFIKVDIEGSELDFLKGAQKTLFEHKLKHIYVEYNGEILAKKGKSFSGFFEAFANYGYTLGEVNKVLAEKLQKGLLDPASIVTDFLFKPS